MLRAQPDSLATSFSGQRSLERAAQPEALDALRSWRTPSLRRGLSLGDLSVFSTWNNPHNLTALQRDFSLGRSWISREPSSPPPITRMRTTVNHKCLPEHSGRMHLPPAAPSVAPQHPSETCYARRTALELRALEQERKERVAQFDLEIRRTVAAQRLTISPDKPVPLRRAPPPPPPQVAPLPPPPFDLSPARRGLGLVSDADAAGSPAAAPAAAALAAAALAASTAPVFSEKAACSSADASSAPTRTLAAAAPLLPPPQRPPGSFERRSPPRGVVPAPLVSPPRSILVTHEEPPRRSELLETFRAQKRQREGALRELEAARHSAVRASAEAANVAGAASSVGAARRCAARRLDGVPVGSFSRLVASESAPELPARANERSDPFPPPPAGSAALLLPSRLVASPTGSGRKL